MRVRYPGAIYHVMSRGDRREDIYLDEVDRHDFLKTLAEASQKTAWQVHAYCLMRNHFHLVVETPEGNLVDGMSWLLSTYTIRLNRRHRMSGHVFSGRYKSPVVDGSGSGYFKTVCDYMHLNPVRAGLLRAEESFAAYPWSSLSWYAAAREHRPSWMRVDRLLGAHGIPHDSAAGRAEFQLRMEARRAEEADEKTLEAIRQDWCFGSEEFRAELVQRMEGKLAEHHSGALHLESSRVRGQRIVAEELSRLGWTEVDLAAQRKNAPEKLVIAARLRKETTLTVKEIAARVSLGTSKSANGKLHRFMKNTSLTQGQSLPSNTLGI
jgi:putative transposase